MLVTSIHACIIAQKRNF